MSKSFIKALCLLLLLAFAIAPSMKAQVVKVTVSGTIVDDSGEPVIGAAVMDPASPTTGVITDFDGRYSISAPAGTTLVVSCLSFKEISFVVPDRDAEMNFALEQEENLLDDVVVVGYGVQKKVNLTGSVSTVNFDDKVTSRPLMDVSQALSGMSSGVSVTRSSGQPGSGSNILIRGNGTLNNNSPLVLVDGIEYSMDNVNPQDIASITILKDASSTAIYGSRAANGVILVTTKTGASRDGILKTSYSFNGVVEFPSIGGLGFVSDYAEYMQLFNEAAENVGRFHVFTDKSIADWKIAKAFPEATNKYGIANSIAYPNTDWFGELFHPAFSQIHNISLEAGSEKVNALVSFGFTDDKGVMNNNNLDTGSSKFYLRANLETKLNSWLTIGTRIFGQKQSYGMSDVRGGFNMLSATTPGVIIGEYNKWGKKVLFEENNNANNIFSTMAAVEGSNDAYRFNGTLYAKARLFDGMSLEVTGNYTPTFIDILSRDTERRYWDWTTDTFYQSTALANASVTHSTQKEIRLNGEALLRYNRTFAGKHDLGALLGFSINTFKYTTYSNSKKGRPDWNITEFSAYTSDYGSDSSTSEWGLMSYFGRVNYAYAGKYLAEANLRADGSSRFAPEKRWGFFPSFSLGWRISEEDWMSGSRKWLSNLKLRASWGVTGNNNSGNYAWQNTYNAVNVVSAGTPTNGLVVTAFGNSNLVWETTYTGDIGLDLGFLDNRLTAEIDGYIKDTDGILYVPTTHVTMGMASGSYANLAAVRNNGAEITLGWRNNVGRDFSYSLGLNLSYNIAVVSKYQGGLQKGWKVDADGNKIEFINTLGDVAQEAFGGYVLEGHLLGDQYILPLYHGSGEGYTTGEVDVNAGPVDGMIRTETDMKWVQAMIDQGYRFRGVGELSRTSLWYGDLIYADSNADGDYGEVNDKRFTGHSSTPKFILGLNLGFNWKNLSFSAVLSGAFGFWLNWNTGFYNDTKVQSGYGISSRIANDHYTEATPDATYPRLTLDSAYGNSQLSEFNHYRGDYLKIKSVMIGYSLPEQWMQKAGMRGVRFFVSGENLLTFTAFPGLDPEMGTKIGYPLMRSVSLGAQITL